jgi:hypothetical protein
MADVQQIEASIGECDGVSRLAPGGDALLQPFAI